MSSSPTCSQEPSASSASTSLSEPRGVAFQCSSACASSQASRLPHAPSLKAQPIETFTGWPTGTEPPPPMSSERLNNKFKHMLLVELSRSNSSNAAAIAPGPARGPSSRVRLSRSERDFDIIRNLGTDGARALDSSAVLPSGPEQNKSPNTRIACVIAGGGKLLTGVWASTDKQSVSALYSANARRALWLRAPNLASSIKIRATALVSRGSRGTFEEPVAPS
mmetsp:Transcript_57975/g.168155  ORF Transcript_57975/g.168155 Transcript_57975/m.168155 type:complete len:222 (-) Transcript_57975:1125-1790(-)